MDFKTYKNTHPGKQSEQKTDAIDQDTLRKTAEAYSGKSDEELLGEIMKAAKQGKTNGTLDTEQINQFIKNVSPMLNQEQRQRLQSVVEMIEKS